MVNKRFFFQVGEPSVGATISILRGLRERYEAHHGVIIEDAALVAAATLSDRYISARYLPDKAIDLVDEVTLSLSIYICIHTFIYIYITLVL